MRKTLIALLALSGVVATAGAVAAAPTTPGQRNTTVLQRDSDQLLDQGAPGVLAEVDTPGGPVRVRSGYGDTKAKTPVPWHAEFRIGSLTKTFTATVLLQLVGEGRLSLDDTVDHWLPGVVSGNGNDGTKITVRQLLQHTSGIPDAERALTFLGSNDAFQAGKLKTYTAPELVAMAMRFKPDFAPGTNWAYSNTNYLLAGMIIKRITGEDWQAQVRRRIIRPLHLRNTYAPYTRPYVPGAHALGYQRFTDDAPDIDVTVQNPSWAGSAGAMISDTADTNIFLRALVGGRLLEPAQLKEMRTTVPATAFDPAWPGIRYGLGLAWVPTSCGGYWSHGGDIPGYKTRVGVTPDARRSVVVSMNTGTLYPKPGVTPAQHDQSNELIEHALCGTS